MKKKEVIRRIQQAASAKKKSLDLRGCRLRELPPEIGRLRHLMHLDLSFNSLTELPEEICLLTRLTELDLSDNHLADPFPIIRCLRSLTSLDLSGNQLRSLPPETGYLTGLTHLDLRDNRLSEIPPKISKLKRITILGLSGNQLTELPPEIGHLHSLTIMDLSFNRLQALPPAFCDLTTLIHLDLSDNRFEELPKEILRLTGLSNLDLRGNRLQELPQEITQLTNLNTLDLSDNQLSGLPARIVELTSLDSLYLEDNPLTSPPLEVGRLGFPAVQQYFASLERESQILDEVRVLVLGEGGSGKTSLTRCLLDEKFDKNESPTNGISIKEHLIQGEEKQVKINIWDFGGREIMDTAHQLFLSPRSLYVLVLDGSRDERLEYWLRHIESFGGDSPVLIILNKQDINPGFTVNQRFLCKKYPQIRGFFQTSCASRHGITEFKEAFIQGLTCEHFTGTRWSKNWFAVKQALEDLPQPSISYKQFAQICIDAGITEEVSQDILLDFLNDLGSIVHSKKFKAKDGQVLDPKWVTATIYKIINAENVAVRNGMLSLSSMKLILDRKDCCHSTTQYRDLIELMQTVELCCPLDEEHVLIPQLLDSVEPEFTFDDEKSLRFVLDYDDFLPQSIMSRFIVKRHRDLKDGLCWRTGIVLENKAFQATAVVRADKAANRIDIAVIGAQRKVYLALIRLSFQEINETFEKLRVTERIPMPDNPKCSAAYTTLITYLENGLESYIPEGSDKIYKINALLKSVQPDDGDVEQVMPNLEDIKSRLAAANVFAEERSKLAALRPDFFRGGGKE
ncbi:MAG: COR domain-containing protein [Candidatus Electrothrix sp. GW3-4]|uniref:leucine-rich repeat domain-containing protein n=1 Tax=Candidatus Electrothrix sp. GW3-4 TaxID=3126740 RepID=UPI0030D2CCC2